MTDVIPARGPAAYVAEFIGTFALVLFITLAVSEFATAPVPSPGGAASQPFIDFSVIGLVHVFALFFLIQTLAVVSGAHFNPAVTARSRRSARSAGSTRPSTWSCSSRAACSAPSSPS